MDRLNKTPPASSPRHGPASPCDAENADTLLCKAAAAMRRAKNLGGNNFQYYSRKMNADAGDRLQCFGPAISQKELADPVRQVFDRPGLEPRHIEIEVTDSAALLQP